MNRILSLLLVAAIALGAVAMSSPAFGAEKDKKKDDAKNAEKAKKRKEALFKKLDANSDEMLSKEEFVASGKFTGFAIRVDGYSSATNTSYCCDLCITVLIN